VTKRKGVENISKKKYCKTTKRISNEDTNDSEDINP
jgi:hypothetical protein